MLQMLLYIDYSNKLQEHSENCQLNYLYLYTVCHDTIQRLGIFLEILKADLKDL